MLLKLRTPLKGRRPNRKELQMKKQNVKKLHLSRETLRHLKESDLAPAHGGLAAGNEPGDPYSKQDSHNVCCA
jgi:hypothetical protein